MEGKSIITRILKKTLIIALILVLLFIGLVVVSNYKYVFPFMSETDYCIETITDKSDGYTIYLYHNKNCPEYTNHWLCEKNSKYDIIIRQKASFCTTCFDKEEIYKLIPISNANLESFCRNLKFNGATDDYIKQRVKFYNTNPRLSEIYF